MIPAPLSPSFFRQSNVAPSARRIHGFQLPWNFFQVFIVFYIFFLVVLFYLAGGLVLQIYQTAFSWLERTSVPTNTDIFLFGIYFTHFIFTLCGFTSWILCSLVDTSHPTLLIKNQTGEETPLVSDIAVRFPSEETYFCGICKILVGKTTKHCHACRKCTKDFD
eukprot:Sdes_comp9326_c0_seq1m814